MNQKKVHIALFMLMVYSLSFTVQAMPSLVLGDVQVKKECPNKKNAASADSDIFDQATEQFTKSTDDQDKQDERPAEVSVCSTSSVFLINDYHLKSSRRVLEKATVVFSPSYYKSPVLESIQEPPQSV